MSKYIETNHLLNNLTGKRKSNLIFNGFLPKDSLEDYNFVFGVNCFISFALMTCPNEITIDITGVPPELSGFICAYLPATPGSSSKHSIYDLSFIVKFVL